MGESPGPQRKRSAPSPEEERAAALDVSLVGKDCLFTLELAALLQLPSDHGLALDERGTTVGDCTGLDGFVYHRGGHGVDSLVLWRAHSVERKPAPGCGTMVLGAGELRTILSTATETLRRWKATQAPARPWVDELRAEHGGLRITGIFCRVP